MLTELPQGGGVEIAIDVQDMAPGLHGFHIHANGECAPWARCGHGPRGRFRRRGRPFRSLHDAQPRPPGPVAARGACGRGAQHPGGRRRQGIAALHQPPRDPAGGQDLGARPHPRCPREAGRLRQRSGRQFRRPPGLRPGRAGRAQHGAGPRHHRRRQRLSRRHRGRSAHGHRLRRLQHRRPPLPHRPGHAEGRALPARRLAGPPGRPRHEGWTAMAACGWRAAPPTPWPWWTCRAPRRSPSSKARRMDRRSSTTSRSRRSMLTSPTPSGPCSGASPRPPVRPPRWNRGSTCATRRSATGRTR